MIRAAFTGLIGTWLLACTSVTKIHMEEVEANGGAAGEASTAADETTTGGAAADASSAGDDAEPETE